MLIRRTVVTTQIGVIQLLCQPLHIVCSLIAILTLDVVQVCTPRVNFLLTKCFTLLCIYLQKFPTNLQIDFPEPTTIRYTHTDPESGKTATSQTHWKPNWVILKVRPWSNRDDCTFFERYRRYWLKHWEVYTGIVLYATWCRYELDQKWFIAMAHKTAPYVVSLIRRFPWLSKRILSR